MVMGGLYVVVTWTVLVTARRRSNACLPQVYFTSQSVFIIYIYTVSEISHSCLSLVTDAGTVLVLRLPSHTSTSMVALQKCSSADAVAFGG